MSGRPDVVPLFPERSEASELAAWRKTFAWIADNPPACWRDNAAARALIAAAERFISLPKTRGKNA